MQMVSWVSMLITRVGRKVESESSHNLSEPEIEIRYIYYYYYIYCKIVS